MAEFIGKCPHCGTEVEAQEEWIGMTVECPICQKTFVLQSEKSNREKESEATPGPKNSPPPKKTSRKKKSKEEAGSSDSKPLSPDDSSSEEAKSEEAKSEKEKSEKEKSEKEKSEKEKSASSKKKDDSGCIGWIFILAILAGGIWLLWTLLTGFPRTCFWIIAPIASLGILFGIGFKGAKALLTILLMAGIIWWGRWAHTVAPSGPEAPTPVIAAKKPARVTEEPGIEFTTDLAYANGRKIVPEMRIFYQLVDENDYMGDDRVIDVLGAGVEAATKATKALNMMRASGTRNLDVERRFVEQVKPVLEFFLAGGKAGKRFVYTGNKYTFRIKTPETGTVFIWGVAEWDDNRISWLKRVKNVSRGKKQVKFVYDETTIDLLNVGRMLKK